MDNLKENNPKIDIKIDEESKKILVTHEN